MAESSTGANVDVRATDVSTNFMRGFTGFGHPGIDRVGYGKISDIYFPSLFVVLVAQADSAGA